MKIAKLPNGKPEIFLSIEGEGRLIGRREIFIRCYGCNMRCKWCDSPHGVDEGEWMDMTPQEITDYIENIPCKTIALTGGEPMVQQYNGLTELCESLRAAEYYIHLYTNGTIWDNWLFSIVNYISMDMKPPSSGMRSDLTLLKKIGKFKGMRRDKFEVKVVIQDEKDLAFALEEIYPHVHRPTTLILQPCARTTPWTTNLEILESYKQLTERILELDLRDNVRILPQLHKVIWSPTERKR